MSLNITPETKIRLELRQGNLYVPPQSILYKYPLRCFKKVFLRITDTQNNPNLYTLPLATMQNIACDLNDAGETLRSQAVTINKVSVVRNRYIQNYIAQNIRPILLKGFTGSMVSINIINEILLGRRILHMPTDATIQIEALPAPVFSLGIGQTHSASSKFLTTGTIVDIEYTVLNSSNETIDNIMVTNRDQKNHKVPIPLRSGEQWQAHLAPITLSRSDVKVGQLHSTVIVNAPGLITTHNIYTIDIPNPSVELSWQVSSDASPITLGSIINIVATVRNNGSVSLLDPTFSATRFNYVQRETDPIDINFSKTYTFSYVVTQSDVDNGEVRAQAHFSAQPANGYPTIATKTEYLELPVSPPPV